MDLMTLAAKIVLDDSSYNKGISNAEKAGQQLAGKMSAMTVAVGNIAADMIKKAVSGIGNVIGSAVEGFADYEQLVGGVETLFKRSASRVEKYAKESYKTTGLSANDYMETVTSFSAALIKGLGGDTQAAAEMANTAITDMADNANKMGTDISAIQVAYQGFAKQNYTMLDNLKLGYGGTQAEMVRLINDSGILNKKIEDLDGITFDQIVQAIHVIQTQMGITGTTAKEAAETISGSKQSMMAAWEDFVTAAAGEGGKQRLEETKNQFVEAFSTYVNNLAPILTTSIANAPTIIDAVVDGITAIPSEAVAKLAEGGLGALTAIFNGGTKLAGWLIDGLVQMFKDINADPSQIAELGEAVGTFIGSALSDIVTSAPTIISGLFTAGVTLASSLIKGLFAGLIGADEGVYDDINNASTEMLKGIEDAEETSTKASGIIDYLDSLVKKYGDAADETQEWADAMKALEDVLPGVNDLVESQNGNLENAVEILDSYNKQIRDLAIEEAKRQALQTKQDAWTTAQANLLGAQSQIMIKESEKKSAEQNLIDFIQRNGQEEFTGKGLSSNQLIAAAYAALNESIGAGNEGYTEAATQLKAWEGVLTTSEDEIKTLKSGLSDLEKQVKFAETEYLTSAAAMEQLTDSIGSATRALALLRNPEMGLSSGQYYNWYYGRQGQGKATGMDFVPYDGFRAELHRGEMVVPASDANKYREGGNVDLSNLENRIAGAVREGLRDANIHVDMDGAEVSRKVSDRVARELGARRYSA